MKEEFLKILNEDYDKKYVNQLTHPDAINTILSQKDPFLREKKLDDFFKSLGGDSDLNEYANPYYIGFGNPNSQILVVGKEKAFNSTSNTDLLIKESINNFAHWKHIVENKLVSQVQKNICNTLGFNPLNPKVHHCGYTKRNHTWGITSEIISGVFPDEKLQLQYTEDQKFRDTIFNKCFLTELNHRPARYHEGSGLSAERATLLKSDFYKTFPIVIFSAKSYLNGKIDILKNVFDINPDGESIKLGVIGKKRIREIIITKYKSKTQTIFVCNQLSGASGWSKKVTEKFSEVIKNELDAYTRLK